MRFSVWRLLLLTGWVGLLLLYFRLHGWVPVEFNWDDFLYGFTGNDRDFGRPLFSQFTGVLFRGILELGGVMFMVISFLFAIFKQPPKSPIKLPEHDWMI